MSIRESGAIDDFDRFCGLIIYTIKVIGMNNYSRKEIVGWVESQTKYKFDQLKNGVFFCRMLAFRFPEQVSRLKYNPAPVSQYDDMCNLIAMKKALNRHGLQMNLNIHSVLTSKSNFELAKWFKSLVDRQLPTEEGDSAAKGRQDSREQKRGSDCGSISNVQTPRMKDSQISSYRKKLESAEKANNSKHSTSGSKRLSMAKSDQQFFKDKKPLIQRNPPEMKMPPMSRKKNQSRTRLNETQPVASFFVQESNEDNISNLLHERALEQTIEGLEKVLAKIEVIVNREETTSYATLKEQLKRAIFEK